jgi:uncharacterized peroxidase-related enzyme
MFLQTPPSTAAAEALYARDIAEDGYVANFIRLWAWRPHVFDGFYKLRMSLNEATALSSRERAVLVCATAASLGDSYCALAWGANLAAESDGATAAAVIQLKDVPALTQREQALAAWARRVVREPNAIPAAEVERLRAVGLSDQDIFDATVFIAFRLAFSTVNDALGAQPDPQMAEEAPAEVRGAVSFGRNVAGQPSR